MVVVGGDFDNLNDQSYSKITENIESEARIASFLSFLEFFCSKIYYVPGNHDPPTMFSDDEVTASYRSLTPFSHNIHKQIKSLSKGLSIVGIGGSIPATKTDFKTGSQEFVWSSYPYLRDSDMETDI